ncbi:MAG: DUF92 domain-containing protein, partial [Candidatus Polarisedimenticolia bacterium]
VLFHDRMEVAAAAWGILAGGDGAAGLIGTRFGRRRLPWNPVKTAAGSAGFLAGALLYGWPLLVWMGLSPVRALLMTLPACLFAAFIESLPWRLDDNLTVPILAALFLNGLLQVDSSWLTDASGPLPGLAARAAAVNLLLAVLFHRLRLVTRSGTIAGFLIGTLTFTFAAWQGFLVLLAFFVLGTAATRLGRRRKARAGTAHETRSARHALANCGVSVYLAFLAAATGEPAGWLLAFVCAYATAAFDTVSSEIGQAYGGRPFLITTFRRVPAGTNGAVSVVGTLAGLTGALLIGGLACALGLLEIGRLWIALAAAFVGSTADSYLGATLEARGLMDNEAVNFSNTLVGALTGLGLAALAAALPWRG